MRDVTVSNLRVYPIKSCQGVDLHEARVVETGFELDREFMLVDGENENRFITQRTESRLAQVRINLDEDGFTVTTPVGATWVSNSYDPNLPAVHTEVHGNSCIGLEQGNDYTELFSDFLGKRVHLLRASREEPRMIGNRQRYIGSRSTLGRVNFGDSFPFLLTSEASLEFLNENFNGDDVPMNRFRPNIVIAGDMEPFVEDGLKQIVIGDTRLFVVRACSRCAIPSIIQEGYRAGDKGTVSVLRHFLHSRKGYDLTKEVPKEERFFGQNLMHVAGGGRMAVGQTVEVLEAGFSNIALTLAA